MVDFNDLILRYLDQGVLAFLVFYFIFKFEKVINHQTEMIKELYNYLVTLNGRARLKR